MAEERVRSEMTGKVWKIVTKVGDKVSDGDEIMILESMKMEIPVMVDTDGTIKEFLVGEGDEVTEDQEIAILET
ncbi:MAG: acetyl-CoA carboxylase biotin carboxyl carrier protein subunit [Alphaproteobacteria bacterium]|nr:acetyl-CoA carboxylase biotin carboxyl carrier protein subunit [Alphaproteobacteria bacterium]